jgi:phosphinothricin acetyltransferase
VQPPYEIRFAERADLPAMIDILNREILESVSCFRIRPLDAQDSERWWQGREGGRFPAWVATDGGGRVVGWASLSRWSAYEGYARTAEVSIWIVPRAQGQGLGRRLFARLLEGAQPHFRVLLSRIEASNRASIALHEKFGFRAVGTMHRVGEKFGRLLDVLIMECQLEEPRS